VLASRIVAVVSRNQFGSGIATMMTCLLGKNICDNKKNILCVASNSSDMVVAVSWPGGNKNSSCGSKKSSMMPLGSSRA
jgi:hypothetical protein